jgi:hypothetical protein
MSPAAQLALPPSRFRRFGGQAALTKAVLEGRMSQTEMIATAPLGPDDDSAEPLRLDADFDARCAAWQTIR